MNRPITRRQVAAILARYGYQRQRGSKLEPEDTAMVKTLGPKADEWIAAYINDDAVCFSTMPFGTLHIASYDVILNPRPPRSDPGTLETEILAAEAIIREARWAVIAHMGKPEPTPAPRPTRCTTGHRNPPRKP